MKKILFVVNTMGQAGAETALVEVLKKLEGCGHEVFLYVLMGQGEMIGQLPPGVRLLNRDFSAMSVLSGAGRRRMARTVARAFLRNGGYWRKLHYLAKIFTAMVRDKRIRISKLLWRIVSDGTVRFDTVFDGAVAWLEGGSAYYVADHVRARKKTAFIHIDYKNAGYTREMDRDCWREFDQIFAVSGEVREHFAEFYPEYACKTGILYNMVDEEGIRKRAAEPGGFRDAYDGIRLVSVGRLSWQKGYDIAVEAMKLLKDSGYKARWYVLGEGDQRGSLEKRIRTLGLKEDFILLGASKNPYPYYVQADIYVHTARFEGRSIAVQEARILGCAIVATDCSGNREEITDKKDGILCGISARAVADGVAALIDDGDMRARLGREAAAKGLPAGKKTKELTDIFL